MTETIARALSLSLELYLGLGLLFALAFVGRGASRIDPAARQSGIGFRLLILPGAVAFWPLLAYRWLRAFRGEPIRPEESNAHRDAAREHP